MLCHWRFNRFGKPCSLRSGQFCGARILSNSTIGVRRGRGPDVVCFNLALSLALNWLLYFFFSMNNNKNFNLIYHKQKLMLHTLLDDDKIARFKKKRIRKLAKNDIQPENKQTTQAPSTARYP